MDENYFNYFTEVEEHFQRARGTGLFLLSPLDWALIENWKNAGIPLEAVLRGIDAAFGKWRQRRGRTQTVNSVAYCAQAIAEEARVMAQGAAAPAKTPKPPFSVDDLRAHLARCSQMARAADAVPEADALDQLAAEAETHYANLEDLERQLTVLEEKLIAGIRASAPADRLLAARRDVDAQLRAYRSKMTAEQLSMLERQLLDRRLLEDARLPRFSLFYLR